MKERIYGIDCEVTREQFPDGKHSVYQFTVHGRGRGDGDGEIGGAERCEKVKGS